MYVCMYRVYLAVLKGAEACQRGGLEPPRAEGSATSGLGLLGGAGDLVSRL